MRKWQISWLVSTDTSLPARFMTPSLSYGRHCFFLKGVANNLTVLRLFRTPLSIFAYLPSSKCPASDCTKRTHEFFKAVLGSCSWTIILKRTKQFIWNISRWDVIFRNKLRNSYILNLLNTKQRDAEFTFTKILRFPQTYDIIYL